MAVSAIAGLAALGIGIYSGLHGAAQAKKRNAAAAALLANAPHYQTSPYATAYLNDTQSRLGATDPAVAAGYQQEQQAMSNRIGAAERSGSSGAEVLAAGGQAQQQFNSSLPSLIGAQSSYNQNARNDYYKALMGMTEEDRLKQQDALSRNADQFNYQLGLGQAASGQESQGISMAGQGLGMVGYYGGKKGLYNTTNTAKTP